tara:strand:+ start:3272 stop:4252 length:981 start_codon:yes stop_codon:yes gene_type:complete
MQEVDPNKVDLDAMQMQDTQVLLKAARDNYGNVTTKSIPLNAKRKPVFVDRFLDPMNLVNHFYTPRRTGAFLILSGPSLKDVNLDTVADCGALTMGVNNSWSVFTPDIWTCVDPPEKFLYSGWMNPQIMKFIPHKLKNKTLRWKAGPEDWVPTSMKAGDAPNTFMYHRNAHFNHRTYLTESSVNWGQAAKKPCSLGISSCRSVMLAAIKILFLLGIRNIYLLGCDFNMSRSKGYAFDQHRSRNSVKGNNRTYHALTKRFEAMKGHFDDNGLTVYNCNPNSALEVFPYKELEDVVHYESEYRKKDFDTLGWYEKEPKSGGSKVKKNG